MTDPRHGTYARYQAGCRCTSCTEAQRLYQQDYRRRRSERGESRANKSVAWKLLANCKDMDDPNVFFPEDGDNAGHAAAKAVCRGCVVRQNCLDYANTWPYENDGVWGAMGQDERKRTRNRKSA